MADPENGDKDKPTTTDAESAGTPGAATTSSQKDDAGVQLELSGVAYAIGAVRSTRRPARSDPGTTRARVVRRRSPNRQPPPGSI